jgi:hypothetical protein
MTLKNDIDDVRNDPARLEHLYRRAVADGEEEAFKAAMALCAQEHQNNVLLSAWVHRLDILADRDLEEKNRAVSRQKEKKHWGFAIAGSIILGGIYALLAGGKPPVPVPQESASSFWIGWGPVTALGLIAYLAVLDHPNRRRWYSMAAFAVALVGGCVAFMAWNQTGDVAILTAIHLPFLVWAMVGMSASVGRETPFAHFHAFIVKSVETLLTAGIYLGAGGLLVGLTVGIFAALGIHFSDEIMRIVAAYGLGTIPLLALASVCDPTLAPIKQNWKTGLSRILHILTRLMLPLTLGVLFVYVCWFIPAYFWRPFQEREVLIVYNATLVAIIALLSSVLPGKTEEGFAKQDRLLYAALLILGILALLLNAYALSAIVSRTWTFGLTANRHAVLGWNGITLLMLSGISFKLWQAGSTNWQYPFCTTLSRVMGLAVVWTGWVLLGLPHF